MKNEMTLSIGLYCNSIMKKKFYQHFFFVLMQFTNKTNELLYVSSKEYSVDFMIVGPLTELKHTAIGTVHVIMSYTKDLGPIDNT